MTNAIKKIDKKIVGYQVKTEEQKQEEQKAKEPEFDRMNESVERPDMLLGSTYKIKTPMTEHAMYITVNDVILNEGTEHESRRPFEIFINSKNMENFQWVVGITRLMSAIFRKGGDITFLVEELKAIFDPKGGHFRPGGVFVPSVVAEIGFVLEKHMKIIGLIEDDELDEHQKKFVADKKAEYEASQKDSTEESKNTFPDSATTCGKCNTKAVVLMDGCGVCLSCADSKCS